MRDAGKVRELCDKDNRAEKVSEPPKDGVEIVGNPLDPNPGSHVWVATIWPDREQPGGWGRLCWDRHPSGRGWTIHPLTHLGDVIEFGADRNDSIDRWYGYVQSAEETSLHIVGPFAEPSGASDDARASLVNWRITNAR